MVRIDALLSASERALVIAGNGIRLIGQREQFLDFINDAALPFVTTWTGADLAPTDHPFNCGIIGMCGQEGANKAVFAADLILALGTHLSIPQTSTCRPWAPQAKKIIVDIDQDQLDNLTVDVDLKVCMDLKDFFAQAVSRIKPRQAVSWLCPFSKMSRHPNIGSYFLNSEMTKSLPDGTTMVVDGGGTALYTGFQSSYVKEGSRLICSSSMSAMGSGLPEAIGACFASGKKLTTCLIGDGSMMFNLQELQTIRTHNLPIKIFIINNKGYLAIRKTQAQFQEGRFYGVGGDDLQFPRFSDVAKTFNIPYFLSTDAALHCEGPAICEWFCDMMQPTLHQKFFNGVAQPLSEMAFD